MKIKRDLTKGDKVSVRNYTLDGREIIEGTATILRKIGQDRFKVHFDGDEGSEVFERFVLPEHRAN